MRRAAPLAIAGFAAILAHAPAARADVPREKAAQAAFDQGMELMKKKKLAEACPKFEESQRLDPGMGTAFRLAECYEGIGRMAKAWALYTLVADEAHAKKNRAREGVARRHADSIEPKLARLTVVVSVEASAALGISITRDGEELPRSEWGASARVDAGEHTIRATAPGKKAWETRTASVAAGTSLDVQVPALVDEGVAAAPAPVAPPPPPPRRGIVPAVVLGAAAAVGVGLGVTGMVVFAGKKGTATDLQTSLGNKPSACAGTAPPAACANLKSAWGSATTFENLGLWAFVGAGVTGAAALAYALWPQPKEGAATGFHVVPTFGPGGGGAFVEGRF